MWTRSEVEETMSWDSYIDNLIAQTKDATGALHVDRACIIGIDGGAAWTTAAHPNSLKVPPSVVCCVYDGGCATVVQETLVN